MMTTNTPRPNATPAAPARPVRRIPRRQLPLAAPDLPLFHAFRG